MTIEGSIDALTNAIVAQTEALDRQTKVMEALMSAPAPAPVATNDSTCGGKCGDDEQKPTRKRKTKAKKKPEPATEPAAAEAGDNVVPMDAAPQTEPAPEPTAQAEPVVETQPPLTLEIAQERLRGIASVMTDTSALFALIQKHGGNQLSELDPSCYHDLIRDAEAALAEQGGPK